MAPPQRETCPMGNRQAGTSGWPERGSIRQWFDACLGFGWRLASPRCEQHVFVQRWLAGLSLPLTGILASPALERIAHPTVNAARRRTPALRFGDPGVMALTGALCQTCSPRPASQQQRARLDRRAARQRLPPRTDDLRPPPTAPGRLTAACPSSFRRHPHRRLLHQDVPDARPAHRCQPTPSTTPLRAALATITRHVDTYAIHAQIPEPPDNLTQMGRTQGPKIVR